MTKEKDMRKILINKMLIGDKKAEQTLINQFGLTQTDILKIKKYMYK